MKFYEIGPLPERNAGCISWCTRWAQRPHD